MIETQASCDQHFTNKVVYFIIAVYVAPFQGSLLRSETLLFSTLF